MTKENTSICKRNTKNITFKPHKRGEKNPVSVPRRLDHLRLLTLERHNYNLKILARVLTIAKYILYCSDGFECHQKHKKLWLTKYKLSLSFFLLQIMCCLLYLSNEFDFYSCRTDCPYLLFIICSTQKHPNFWFKQAELQLHLYTH